MHFITLGSIRRPLSVTFMTSNIQRGRLRWKLVHFIRYIYLLRVVSCSDLCWLIVIRTLEDDCEPCELSDVD